MIELATISKVTAEGVVAPIESRVARGQQERISHADGVGLGSSKLRHPIEDVARDHCLDLLRFFASRPHPIPEDRLESEERVLGSSLSMVADLLLPLASPDLADPMYSSIASPR